MAGEKYALILDSIEKNHETLENVVSSRGLIPVFATDHQSLGEKINAHNYALVVLGKYSASGLVSAASEDSALTAYEFFIESKRAASPDADYISCAAILDLKNKNSRHAKEALLQYKAKNITPVIADEIELHL